MQVLHVRLEFIGPLALQALASAGAFQAAKSNLIGAELRYQMTLDGARQGVERRSCGSSTQFVPGIYFLSWPGGPRGTTGTE